MMIRHAVLAALLLSFGLRAGNSVCSDAEVLYNGIRLPAEWPPRNMDPKSDAPMPVPYLKYPPSVIPIDIGRQLFVDSFLIEATTLKRKFHLATKYASNPILKPETELELNQQGNALACPKSGGIWWDPQMRRLRMWYEAGWLNTVCYATSSDGLKWQRPSLPLQPGANRVLDASIIPDSWTVFPDYEGEDPQRAWKMFLRSPGGSSSIPGKCLVSADGIHWSKPIPSGPTGDRSTLFYNPFRKKWIFSLRSSVRGRSRHYWECDDFLKGANWQNFTNQGPDSPVFWTGADSLDLPDPAIGNKPQLYNLDAVAYESIMLGLYTIHLGPPNADGMKTGIPKITDLELAYSRDGFHWDRPDRRAFIASSRTNTWDRGYVQSVGGVCLLQGDKLWFYYSGVRGNPGKLGKDVRHNGMYDQGSTGIAFLRRDGFASLEAGPTSGYLLTRPVKFKGSHLFVNVDNPKGSLRVEVLNTNGTVIEPYTKANCSPVSADATLREVRWARAKDLSRLAGQAVKLKFHLTNGGLYSFWVSPDESGASYGYVAAGGIGFRSLRDTLGRKLDPSLAKPPMPVARRTDGL